MAGIYGKDISPDLPLFITHRNQEIPYQRRAIEKNFVNNLHHITTIHLCKWPTRSIHYFCKRRNNTYGESGVAFTKIQNRLSPNI